MNNLQSLKCYICLEPLVEFIVLACNHTICSNCLTAQSDDQSSMTAVPCPCGITTNLVRCRDSPSPLTHLKPSQSAPHLKKNRTQILDKTSFTIFQYSPSRVKHKQCSKAYQFTQQKFKGYKPNNINNYLWSELENQVKFMELRFKRYLNQINRSFNKLISQLSKDFEKVLKSSFSVCKSKIELTQIKSLAQIQRQIQKMFKVKLQKKLININKMLDKQILLPVLTQQNQNQSQCVLNVKQCRNTLSKQKRISTHENCKTIQSFLTNLKPSRTKQSKLRKVTGYKIK